jgi:hypothetical protein
MKDTLEFNSPVKKRTYLIEERTVDEEKLVVSPY